ncbi:hypothetical protein QBC43DRAFT_323295 [Cladorrhinum sp. PSN259]|nr:hypothetical protein QBC43DRAFT_323295 [Cladorrhinum sp. PSN259]
MPSLQLVQDVVNAPEAELRAVVRAFCVADRQVYGRLSDYLENLQQARLPVTGRKRKRNISDFRVCYRCEKAFFESENTEGVCQYHPGLFSIPGRFTSE